VSNKSNYLSKPSVSSLTCDTLLRAWELQEISWTTDTALRSLTKSSSHRFESRSGERGEKCDPTNHSTLETCSLATALCHGCCGQQQMASHLAPRPAIPLLENPESGGENGAISSLTFQNFNNRAKQLTSQISHQSGWVQTCTYEIWEYLDGISADISFPFAPITSFPLLLSHCYLYR
jgi:hypothetical protein